MTTTETKLDADGYFLSPTNPLATADQRDLEALAMELVQMPAVREARDTVKRFWKGLLWRRVTDERTERVFEDFIDSFVFHYALEAANSDPNYPRIVRVSELEHEWFGMKVPSSRYGGDNPDTRYSIMPVDNQATFVLHGRINEPRPADQTFNLMSDPTPRQTVLNRYLHDLNITEDGTFTIVVSPTEPEPGPGVNYFPPDFDTRWLYTRDSFGDWANEVAMSLRIERITPPDAPRLTRDKMALRTARFATYEVASMGYYVSLIGGLPHNVFSPPAPTPGGLATQLTSFANLKFADDEAVVLTVSGSDAGYHSMVLSDFTMGVLATGQAVVQLNHATAAPNGDDTFTYVVSKTDPGVYNWLNPMGWNEVYGVQRWQDMALGLETQPTSTAQLVKLDQLRKVLPAATRWVTPDEREQQVAKRRADHLLRFVDC